MQTAIDFTQTVYDANSTNNGWALAETNVGQFAFYVQGRWNVSDKFNLTVGIRGDKPLYFNTSEKIMRISTTEAVATIQVLNFDEQGNSVLF